MDHLTIEGPLTKAPSSLRKEPWGLRIEKREDTNGEVLSRVRVGRVPSASIFVSPEEEAGQRHPQSPGSKFQMET